jgi:chromate transporter
VLPSFALLLLLSGLHAQYGTVPEVEGIVAGLGAAVVALIAVALLRIGRRAIRGPGAPVIAATAFALLLVGVPFPVVVAGGAVAGVVLGAQPPVRARAGGGRGAAGAARPHTGRHRRLRRALLLAAVVWVLPLAALAAAGGVYGDLAWFFTATALVTFGGAYAVLPFVADAAVTRFHWLTADQMVAGLALGETTPGPLIMVNTFVGYIAGFGADGHPGGVLGAAVTTLATFAPSFVFIFAVTAVVIGAIAALAVFVAGEVLVDDGRPDLVAIAMTVAAFVALWRFRLPVVAVVAAAGLVGLTRTLVG